MSVNFQQKLHQKGDLLTYDQLILIIYLLSVNYLYRTLIRPNHPSIYFPDLIYTTLTTTSPSVPSRLFPSTEVLTPVVPGCESPPPHILSTSFRSLPSHHLYSGPRPHSLCTFSHSSLVIGRSMVKRRKGVETVCVWNKS